MGSAALRVVRSHHGRLLLSLGWGTSADAEAALVLGAAVVAAEALASQDWREGSQEEPSPVPCSQQTIHSQDWRRERFRCSCSGGCGG